MDDPFFSASLRDGVIVTSGQTHCDLGCPVVGDDGQPHDGIYASWSWDGHSLHATNDRYGFFPLLYCVDRNRVVVSPSLSTLMEVSGHCEPDLDALAVFFHLGYFLGDDTPLRNIRVLGPAGRLRWTPADFEVTSKPPEPSDPLDGVSFDDAVDRYIDLFKAAVAKRLPQGPFVLPLSGGKDSRHILFELLSRGCRPEECVTARMYPPRPNADVEAARALSQALGLRHVTLELAPRLEAEKHKNELTNFCTDEHTWMIPLVNHLRGRDMISYDGIAGDVLSASRMAKPHLHALFRAGQRDELVDQLLSRDASPLFAMLPEHWRPASPRTIARQRLLDQMDQVQHWPNPVNSLVFWTRTRREISLLSYGLLRNICRTHSPFLDHDLFDFLTHLPSDVIQHPEFHRTAISRAYPRWKDLPYGQPSPSRGGFRSELRFASAAAQYAWSQNPQWRPRLPAIARQWFHARKSTYRNRWLYFSPQRLVYAVQLQALCLRPASSAPSSANPPIESA